MPRLIKGEISPGVQAKTDAARKSALRRIEYFQALQHKNDSADDAWLGFKSIENLSQLSILELGIEPISPKTLRKHMLSMYEGGVSALLADAKKILESRQSVNSRTGESKKFKDLKAKVEIAVDSALEMTARYLDLLEKFQKIAFSNDAANIELDRHFRRYGSNPHIRLVKE